MRRLDPLRRRSPGGFRTVHLNAAGWAVLAAAGLAAGGLSAVAGTPLQIALPAGVVAAWLVALVLDTVRWRNQTAHIGRDGLNETTGRAIVARLRDAGIDAAYREYIDDDLDVHLSIECRNADADRVRGVMDEVLTP